MPFFPYIQDYINEEYMTTTEYRIFFSIHVIDTIIYLALWILAVINIWLILIKQGKWRTMPLLTFYIYSFLVITMRIFLLIVSGKDFYEFGFIITYQQPVAKIVVGVIQSWIIFELALRIRE